VFVRVSAGIRETLRGPLERKLGAVVERRDLKP
jgi:hypothetical protein